MTFERKHLYFLAIILIISFSLYLLFHTSYTGPSYIEDPIQSNISPKTITHYYNNETEAIPIELLAEYTVSARVKGTKKYNSDGSSDVSPLDFALVWGNLADSEIDKCINYSQRGRWYYFNTTNTSIAPVSYIQNHSANTHIIPSNENVLDLIRLIRPEDYITLEGYLVSVKFDAGDWSSSLSRNDSGNGACEILYVERVTIH